MTAADLALIGVDSSTILYVWGWGFGSVMLTWFAGYVTGVAVDLIRKA
jgi:hypothetical protein